MEIATAAVAGREGWQLLLKADRPFQVRRAAEQLGDGVGQELDDLGRGLDPGLGRRRLRDTPLVALQALAPALRKAPFAQAVKQGPAFPRKRIPAIRPGPV